MELADHNLKGSSSVKKEMTTLAFAGAANPGQARWPRKGVLRQWTLLRRLGAATLLIAVACTHAYFVSAWDLTQWKGGGFGMFSTVDAGGLRQVRVRLKATGMEYVASASRSSAYRSLERLTRRLPSQENLGALADRWSRQIWVLSPDQSVERMREAEGENLLDQVVDAARRRPRLHAWSPEHGARGRIVLVESVEATVYRYVYVMETGTMTMSPIRSVTRPGMELPELAKAVGMSEKFLRSLLAASDA